jgi:nucleoside-diphosphate-sugar epimerase
MDVSEGDGMTRLLAIGLGYSARAVAARMPAQDWHVTGTSRREDELAGIRALGYEAVPFSDAPLDPAFVAALREATHLLLSAPPARGDEISSRGAHGDDPVLGHPDLRREMFAGLRWAGYLSTIGVYGDHGGAWVDEETPASPASSRSLKRAAVEAEWQGIGQALGFPVAVMRLSGIYGPGRNALARLKAGTERRLYKPDQVFNRIHVEDIAGAVEASIARSMGGVFNITDDEPAPPQDVIAYAAELLGMEPPPLVRWDSVQMTPMGRSFWLENKRVRNKRMTDVLGYRLRYPTYREGLRALLASEEASWEAA